MDKSTLGNYMNPRILELYIFPTEQCNFRCTYCYEDFEIGQMKDNTVQAVKKLILKRLPTLSRFHLSWFGGEPLMAKNIVLELNEFAQRECLAAGVKFSSSMTTNAFGMDSKTFDDLVGLDVRHYQISIDGDEDEHNKTRKLISGRGTFEKIWNNLVGMKENSGEFKTVIRVHVHAENIDSVKELLPKINAEFGSDPRFSIFLKAVGNWGGESVKKMSLVKKSGEVITELKAMLDTLGWFNARPEGKEMPSYPCYAARPNSIIVRANGTLGKCTVALSDARNSVGHINDDGTLHIEDEKMRAFMRGFQSLDENALHCPMNGMPKLDEEKIIRFEKRIPIDKEITESA